MSPQFFVSDSKIYYCVYRNGKEIKYCTSFELDQKEKIQFDDILLSKKDKDGYVVYKDVDCFDKFNVRTKSGKNIQIYEDKLREVLNAYNKNTLLKIRRIDVYEDYIYMNVELWKSQDDNAEIFSGRELLELDIAGNEFRKMINSKIK